MRQRFPRYPKPKAGDRVQSVTAVSGFGVVTGTVLRVYREQGLQWIALEDIKCEVEQPAWWCRHEDFLYTPYGWRPV